MIIIIIASLNRRLFSMVLLSDCLELEDDDMRDNVISKSVVTNIAFFIPFPKLVDDL